jgi:hypothetical protein
LIRTAQRTPGTAHGHALTRATVRPGAWMVQLGVRHHAINFPLSSDKQRPTEALSRTHDHLRTGA